MSRALPAHFHLQCSVGSDRSCWRVVHVYFVRHHRLPPHTHHRFCHHTLARTTCTTRTTLTTLTPPSPLAAHRFNTINGARVFSELSNAPDQLLLGRLMLYPLYVPLGLSFVTISLGIFYKYVTMQVGDLAISHHELTFPHHLSPSSATPHHLPPSPTFHHHPPPSPIV